MAPTCSNCGGNEFVWSNELKTGTGFSGTGTLSLRARGEIPLGTRICRSCGHADLFLRDLTILQKPHTWRPGEFIPIQSRPRHAAPTSPHATTAGSSPTPAAETERPALAPIEPPHAPPPLPPVPSAPPEPISEPLAPPAEPEAPPEHTPGPSRTADPTPMMDASPTTPTPSLEALTSPSEDEGPRPVARAKAPRKRVAKKPA
ncbi:MAG: hypothetical protein ACREDK_02335 [Thermoplasmata archaeon]